MGDVVSMAIGSIGMIGVESGIVGNAYGVCGVCHSYRSFPSACGPLSVILWLRHTIIGPIFLVLHDIHLFIVKCA